MIQMSHHRTNLNESTGNLDDAFNLDESLEYIRHYLPSQAPLKDFIHHNTLHAFQDRPFAQAVNDASHIYGARRTLSLREYEHIQAQGKIDDAILQRILKKSKPRNLLSQKRISHTKLRATWTRILGKDLSTVVNPLLIRLISQYLDQGISYWTFPGADTKSFYDCVGTLSFEKGPPCLPLTGSACRQLLAQSPKQCIIECLRKLVKEPGLYTDYLWEILFDLPGWSGLVSVIERTPELLFKTRKISLLDFAAIRLVIEVGMLDQYLGSTFKPLKCTFFSRNSKMKSQESSPLEDAFQEALEETYYARTADALLNHKEQLTPNSPSVQAFFCLDDRETSLRRYLEAIDPTVETFGTAGFFAIDAMVHREGELFPAKSCPAPMVPKHLIRQETSGNKALEQERIHSLIAEFQGSETKTIINGLINLPFSGLKASLRLILDVLNPLAHGRAYGLDRVPTPGAIHVDLDENNSNSRYQLGYSVEEMASRVENVLRSSGLTSGFAPIIVMLAHGSSSVNNPYFAAYNCGACSGKPGAPNAKAFAVMANKTEVRNILTLKYDINIPESTLFIGGIHDTCRDEIELFDIDEFPDHFKEKALAFKTTLERALDLNAVERCSKFDLIPNNISHDRARKALRDRALSIFEPRPEFNHANNASCIVGRRSLTKGLNLDRRAFLQSYDPSIDSNGDILNNVLSAVVPVCGGINLEYYFSRLDPLIYGSGSKLPHNVAGLMGVINGAEGDILTGLPTQMTEFHDPVRLMLVIEQKPAVVISVLERNQSVAQWIRNDWVQLFVLDTDRNQKVLYRFSNGEFTVCKEMK